MENYNQPSSRQAAISAEKLGTTDNAQPMPPIGVMTRLTDVSKVHASASMGGIMRPYVLNAHTPLERSEPGTPTAKPAIIFFLEVKTLCRITVIVEPLRKRTDVVQ